MALTSEKWVREFRIWFNVDTSAALPTDFPVVDEKPGDFTSQGEALHASFNVRKHVLLEPHPCEIVIYNMPADQRADLTNKVNEARAKAARDQTGRDVGSVTIEAGYDGDVGTLGLFRILDVTHERSPGSADIVTTVEALDGRIWWNNFFVNSEGIPGVPLTELQGIIDAAADFEAGLDISESYAKILPAFQQVSGGSPGAKSGFTMFGPTRDVNRDLLESLGLRAFFDGSQLRMIVAGSADWRDAVQLQIGEDVLFHSPRERGFVDVTTLLDHRLSPGRQVKLLDKLGVPAGALTFRVDDVEHSGSNFDAGYFTRAILRPTGPPAPGNLEP